MLSLFLVDQLKDKVERTPNAVFAYFFFDNKDMDRNTPIAMLRSVIRQLLLQKQELFHHIQAEFKEKGGRLFENFDALWRVLETMLRDAGDVFVLIDALDECAPLLRKDLLVSINRLFSKESTPSERFKFIIACRPDEDIENFLNPVGVSLRVNSSNINLDLSDYIDQKVEELSVQINYSLDLKAKVRDALSDNAQGTFLWVSLMVANLKEVLQYDVEETLETLPNGLDETYARILVSIPEKQQRPAQFLLCLIVAAERPLGTYDIAAAFGTWKTGSIPPDDRLHEFSDIRLTCSSILHVDGDDNSSGPGGATVNLLHQSVKEYLLRTSSAKNELPYHVPLHIAHLFMLRVCCEYLSEFRKTQSDQPPNNTEHNEYVEPEVPFFNEYARHMWIRHALAGYPATLHQFENNFDGLQKVSIAGGSWLQRTAPEGQQNVLHLLTADDVNSADDLDTIPFFEAVSRGHETVVNLLLKTSVASIASRDKYDSTTLLIAAKIGHGGVVSLLLKAGVDVDLSDQHGWTPLLMAVKEGHEGVTRLLLKAGANIDLGDDNGLTALFGAAASGSEVAVKLLLEAGADVDLADGLGRTPLFMAARNRHEGMVKLLLESGANINLGDDVGRAPLLDAAEKGHDGMVKLLLEAGANIDLSDLRDCRPLLMAVHARHEGVVRLLLEAGANANSSDKNGRTPFLMAAVKGNEVVVKLLLNAGANVDLRSKDSWTPLLIAVEWGHKAIVKLILAAGEVNIYSEDKFGRTPFSIAEESGDKEMVELLLSSVSRGS
jgi:ankyrin repeat protein